MTIIAVHLFCCCETVGANGKIILKWIGERTGLNWLRTETVAGSYKQGNETLGSEKSGQLSVAGKLLDSQEGLRFVESVNPMFSHSFS